MNPILFAIRRPVTTMILVVALICGGGVIALNRMQVDIVPQLNTPKIHAYLDYVGMHAKQMKDHVIAQVEPYLHKKEEEEEHHADERKIVVTSPKAMDVTITQPYVCQIRSQRYIEVCALEGGYLKEIKVREGQSVKQGQLMFEILPTLFQAKLNAEVAEAELAGLEYTYTKQLSDDKVVSPKELALNKAKLEKAQAHRALAQAELNFTTITAPFDGIVDKLLRREGSLIKENDILTTLSDNSVMWVYFNVPEKDYLDYMAHRAQREREDRIQLKLANQDIFVQPGKIGAIESKFNNETGNIAFRADFPNPDRVLRHGQTGTILINRTLKDAVVIPQRAVFELLDKRYVWLIDENDVAHQTLITIKHELDDIFVVNTGLEVGDKIVLEGVRQVEDGKKVEYEFRTPEDALKNQKFHAE